MHCEPCETQDGVFFFLVSLGIEHLLVPINSCRMNEWSASSQSLCVCADSCIVFSSTDDFIICYCGTFMHFPYWFPEISDQSQPTTILRASKHLISLWFLLFCGLWFDLLYVILETVCLRYRKRFCFIRSRTRVSLCCCHWSNRKNGIQVLP